MSNDANIDILLDECLARLNGTRLSGNVYGWNKKSAGAKCFIPPLGTIWIRVHYRNADQKEDKLWNGAKDAKEIAVPGKPQLYAVDEFESSEFIVRYECSQYVEAKPCSKSPELRISLPLNDSWFSALEKSLSAIEKVVTERVSIREDLIRRRIEERFAIKVDLSVLEWSTIHGDLHWANITAPEFWLLDWEGWGCGPRRWDICFLFCFALLVPDVAEKIKEKYSAILTSPTGVLGQLFVCAELLMMIERYGDHPALAQPLKDLASTLISTSIPTLPQ